MRSAIILAGGKSTRIGTEKGLQILGGKPLIEHVIARISECVNEVIVVVGSQSQKQSYYEIGVKEKIIIDEVNSGTPIIGAYSGFKSAKGKYCILIGNDMPFLNKQVIDQLFKLAEGHDAATPYWPNGWIEPLLSVYKKESALKVAKKLVDAEEKKLGFIIRSLDIVIKFDIDDIQKIDPELYTLFDIDTLEDHQKAEKILSTFKN